jgi:hypothetical protein
MSHCPRPASICLGFPSLAEQPKLYRSASGYASVAKLAPCEVCLPAMPSRYATASSSSVDGSRTSSCPATRKSSRSARAPQGAPPRSSPSRYRSYSREVGPAEVCPLSRGMMSAHRLNPYPPHYRPAFASFAFICPHPHKPPSRLACFKWTRIPVYRIPPE